MVVRRLVVLLLLLAAVASAVIIPKRNAVCEAGVCDHWQPPEFACSQQHARQWTCTPLPSGQAYAYVRVSCTAAADECTLRYAAHPPARLALQAPGASITLFSNKLVSSRRHGPPRAQVQCVGRCPAGMFCKKNEEWECLASDQHRVFVTCEGYAGSNDTYALANGCSAVFLDACVLWAGLGALAGLVCALKQKPLIGCACAAAAVAMCAQAAAFTRVVWKSPDAFFIT